jgi:hypothetical protein
MCALLRLMLRLLLRLLLRLRLRLLLRLRQGTQLAYAHDEIIVLKHTPATRRVFDQMNQPSKGLKTECCKYAVTDATVTRRA